MIKIKIVKYDWGWDVILDFYLDCEVGEVFQFSQGLQRFNLDKKIYSDTFLVTKF